MSLIDAVYGAFPTMNGGRYYGTGGRDTAPPSTGPMAVTNTPAPALNPAATATPANATHAAPRPLADEPGAGARAAFSLGSLGSNPATWLVLCIAGALVAARYAATGKFLG